MTATHTQLWALALMTAACAQGPVELLNPGFEQADPQRAGMPLGWGTYPAEPVEPLAFVWDERVSHTGDRSVRIDVGPQNASWLPAAVAGYANSLEPADLGRLRPTAIVGHEYLLSAWVKAEGSAAQNAALVLRWTDENGWVPKYTRRYFALQGDGWQQLAVAAFAPEGSRWIVPILQVGGSDRPGRIWFDDVRLVDRTGMALTVVQPPELVEPEGVWETELLLDGPTTDRIATVRYDSPTPGVEPPSAESPPSAGGRTVLRYRALGAHRLTVTMAAADGTPYFLETLEAPSPLDAWIASPLYRRTIYGDSRGRTLRVTADLRVGEALRRRLALRVAVGELAATSPTSERRATVELPLPALPAGETSVTVELRLGERVIATQEVVLQVRPGADPPVRIGDHNELIVNGRPTFPLGFYSTPVEDFAGFAAAGFNTVLTYHTDAQTCAAMADAAAQHGLGLIASVMRPAVETRDAAAVESTAASFRDRPGVLGYYLWDEPSPGTAHQSPEDMRWLHDHVAAADPNHLTTIVHCRPGDFARYAEASDVFMVDPYPTFHDREPDLELVSTWVDQARAAVADRRPVWLVPQCFHHVNGPGLYRMPTVAEQRSMVYLGLVHGIKGILWFVYTGYCEQDAEQSKARGTVVWKVRGTIPKYFPDEWAGIVRLVAEIRELEPFLLGAEPAQRPQVVEGGEAIHCALRANDGELVLLAVNSKNRPVAFGCRVPGTEAEVLWENRRIAVAEGILRDRFEPYATHVYRLHGGGE